MPLCYIPRDSKRGVTRGGFSFPGSCLIIFVEIEVMASEEGGAAGIEGSWKLSNSGIAEEKFFFSKSADGDSFKNI